MSRISAPSRHGEFSRRAAFGVLAAIAFGGLAAAQTPARAADAWQDVVAAAQKEGSVVVYSAQGPSVMDRIKADFEKTYPGIRLEQTRMSSGPMMSRLDQEHATGADGADVTITTETGWIADRIKEGSLKAPIGPNAANWPAKYMMSGVSPVLALEPFGITYNSQLVKTPPTDYKDLLKPEYKGNFGIIDLTATSIVAFYDWLEQKEGPDFLKQLAAQQPQIYGSDPIGSQMVASGELPAAIFMNATMTLPLASQGAPIKMVYPSSVFGIQYVAGIVGWSKRPNAAQVFVDYLMSRAGQTAWNGMGEAASPLPNIPGSADVSKIVTYDAQRYTPEFQKTFRAHWDSIFKK